MRVALKAIGWVYILTGAIAGARYGYALLFGGPQDELGNAVLALILGFGLLRYSALARVVALFLAGLSVLCGVVALVLCVAHVTGYAPVPGGLIVEYPFLAFLLLGWVWISRWLSCGC
jgi:hypothetical protein